MTMGSILMGVVLLGLVAVMGANAKVIHIPVGQQAPEKKDLPRLMRGMSAEAVLEHSMDYLRASQGRSATRRYQPGGT
jgi:hypothetical protein